MDIEQLRNFVQVAERGSFTKAAEACFLSQSALSRCIAKLEEELGQPLLERQPRSVVLTDAGSLLLKRARQILTLVDDAKAEIADDGQTGTVRVGAIPTITPYYLPTQLARFEKEHPKARVIVHEDTTENLLKKLSDGVVDLAICALPIQSKYLNVDVLFQEELLLVMAADHPLAKKKSIRASDINFLPFVLLGEAHCLTDSVLAFCHQKSFQPVSIERTSQLATVQELVSLNHGISFIPEMARRLDTSDRRVYRSLAGDPPMRSIVVVTNPYRYQSKLESHFRVMLRSS